MTMFQFCFISQIDNSSLHIYVCFISQMDTAEIFEEKSKYGAGNGKHA